MQEVHFFVSANYQWRVHSEKSKLGDFNLMKNPKSVDEVAIF
jgi:hypothetical protein